MLNQYVNLSPQQRMAQMLQQQGDQTQGAQMQGAQMPAPQNPLGGMQDAISMYGKMSQQNNMNEMQDYIARMKATNGMADMASAGGGYTANNGT